MKPPRTSESKSRGSSAWVAAVWPVTIGAVPGVIIGQSLIVLAEVTIPSGRAWRIGRGLVRVDPTSRFDFGLFAFAIAGLALGLWGAYLLLRPLLHSTASPTVKLLGSAPLGLSIAILVIDWVQRT